ncbi:flavin reductase family protein [Acutalibacter sp. 1XD8-36]|uniref:flavin reductase family protein n=1 Tax=Acutalibacter sp. 1XD8-36 TaxID=2320852 RepID=UPI001411BFFB|nr:flavin reductase [Acutalibacter sp. 1XD8-36]NBJ89172.1 flavin reductase [Acutalibacter sp. 1XD8-36]
MAKIKGEISNDFCPQALYLYGNYEEDGTPHFGLFCWYGWCWLGEGNGKLGVMACIGEEKRTKDLIRRTGMFSANLVNEPLLPLADYYGCVSGRDVPDKMKRLPTVERGQALDVPTIAESPVSLELKVVKEESLSKGRLGPECSESTLFLCEVVNVTIDERLTDKSLPVIERMKLSQPVSSMAEEAYVNFFGQELAKWGEPMKSL